jgi:hypothetical protein
MSVETRQGCAPFTGGRMNRRSVCLVLYGSGA